MDDELPPRGRMPADHDARTGAWRLAAPAAVFLAHFAAVYGWVGLACAFRWDQRAWGGWALVPAVVLLATVLAVVAVWAAMPRAEPAPAEDVANPYDPSERRHFLATASRLSAWLAIAGMVLVALPAVLARTCAPGA